MTDTVKACAVNECGRDTYRRSDYCRKHHDRLVKHGSTDTPFPPPAQRFRDKYVIEDGHWIWVGAITEQGYGRMRVDAKMKYAHRFAYESYVEPIPDGMHVDHLCRIRACVNPDHLEAVEPVENSRRIRSDEVVRGQVTTTCHRGHEITEENSYWGGGHRSCAACRRENGQRRDRRVVVCPACGEKFKTGSIYRHTERIHGFRFSAKEAS